MANRKKDKNWLRREEKSEIRAEELSKQWKKEKLGTIPAPPRVCPRCDSVDQYFLDAYKEWSCLQCGEYA